MKIILLLAALMLSLSTTLVTAGNINIPEEEPVATLKVPDAWSPEVDEDGILAESPDNAITIYLEVVGNKEEMDAAIEGSITWLTDDHKVKVEGETKKESEFESEGRKWSRISWDASSEEWGPAVVGFLFTEVGGGKVLTVTYWVLKKDSEKSLETLGKIIASVKSVQ